MSKDTYKVSDVLKDIASNNLEVAPAALVAARNAVCDTCPANTIGICGECGCVLALKTRLLKSSCPIDLW